MKISNRARRKYGHDANKAIKMFRDIQEEYKDKGVYNAIIIKFRRAKRNPKKYIMMGRNKGYINY